MQIYEPRLKTLEHHISGLHIRTAQNPEDPSLRDFANRAIRFFGDDANNIRGEILAAVNYEYSYPPLPGTHITGSRLYNVLKNYIHDVLCDNREISPEPYFNAFERRLKYGASISRLRRQNAVNALEPMINEEGEDAMINIGENIRVDDYRIMGAPAVIMPPRPPGFYDRPQRQNADDTAEEVNVAFGNNDDNAYREGFEWLAGADNRPENAVENFNDQSQVEAQENARNGINQEISDAFLEETPDSNVGIRSYIRAARSNTTPSR